MIDGIGMKQQKPTIKTRAKSALSSLSFKSLGNPEADALFFSIGEGAITTDERGNITRINKVALDILGFQADEVVGKWYPETIIAEDDEGKVIPNIDRPITEAFLSGNPVFKRVYYRRKDGSRVPAAVTVSPLMLNDEPLGAIEVFRDITQETELENSKDEFISIASHQLRTPATVVKQYMGMLLGGYVGDLTKPQIAMLQKAYDYNNNQLHIINDLLKIAQADANKIVPIRKDIDLVSLLREVISSQEAGNKDCLDKIRFSSTVKSVICNVDPLHIRMVIENLLSNACKYSSPKSIVNVSLSTSAKYKIIQIKDKGIGISRDDIPKLFQKFSRVHNPKSTVSGNGLGLYWAKKLIDLHDGTISVTSVPGKGTTFTVKLPTKKQHENNINR